jgi:high-affinity iron transporter
LASDDLLPTLGSTLWDTSHVLRQDSLIGRPLHILVGYDDRPSGIQLAAWMATLVGLFVAERTMRQRKPTAG